LLTANRSDPKGVAFLIQKIMINLLTSILPINKPATLKWLVFLLVKGGEKNK